MCVSTLTCGHCGQPAELVRGDVLHPHLRHCMSLRWFWVCRPCDARVGCHKGSTEPMGSLADKPTRAARSRAHKAFDPFWQDEPEWRRATVRKRWYKWLARQLGISVDDCHMGMMDVATCDRVVAICNAHRAQDEFDVTEGVA